MTQNSSHPTPASSVAPAVASSVRSATLPAPLSPAATAARPSAPAASPAPAAPPAPSDLAVDGLLRGLAAGAAMAGVLVAAGLLVGLTPSQVLASIAFERPAQPLNGLLAHLAISAVYGIVWAGVNAAAARALGTRPGPRWILGLLYGGALYAVAALLVLPTSPLARIPWPALLAAHLVYGSVLARLGEPAFP